MIPESEIKYDIKKMPTSTNAGEWGSVLRIFRPIVINQRCVKCGVCAVVCPDNCILMKGFPAINYNVCTGCLICLRECPVGAISEEREK